MDAVRWKAHHPSPVTPSTPWPFTLWQLSSLTGIFIPMPPVDLRPRSVSEIVDAAAQLYRRHGLQVILAAALAYVPWLVVSLILTRGAGYDPNDMSFVALLGTFVSYGLMEATVLRVGSQVYLGEEVDVPRALSEMLPRLATVLVAIVLKYMLLVVGVFLLLVGALYVAARYFAVVAAVVIEGKGVMAAFARSSELSEGRKRHILNTLILTYLIYIVLSSAVAILAAALGSPLVMFLISAIFTVILYPFVALAEVALYYDARIRGEGLDVELMARELGDPGAQPAAS